MSVTYPESWKDLKAVFVHDWLTGMRGGEHVLGVLCNGFPQAPIFTLVHNRKAISEAINRHPITTSWIQRTPNVLKFYRYWLPFFPGAIERMKVPEADVLISSSHCVAKGIRPREGMPHVCYCHTPMRYAWTFYEEYFGSHPLKKIALKPTLNALRNWDRKTVDRVDHFVANSENVRQRIKEFYDRDADVVYPPVDTERLTPGRGGSEKFDLVVSALVPYKRIDLAVRAYNRLRFPLRIVGVGSDMDALKRLAAPNITFMGWQSDETIKDLYRRCRCLVFPGEEDFGIVPVEAQACGKPVVAYRKGGALESVIEGETGMFFDEQNERSLMAAVEACNRRRWDADTIRTNADRFGIQRFIDGMDTVIQKALKST